MALDRAGNLVAANRSVRPAPNGVEISLRARIPIGHSEEDRTARSRSVCAVSADSDMDTTSDSPDSLSIATPSPIRLCFLKNFYSVPHRDKLAVQRDLYDDFACIKEWANP